MKSNYYFSQLLKKENLFLNPNDGSNLQQFIDIAFTIFGAIAVFVVVYMGILLIISQGNPEKVAQARRGIIYSIVGLLVISSSWIIVSFIIKGFSK